MHCRFCLFCCCCFYRKLYLHGCVAWITPCLSDLSVLRTDIHLLVFLVGGRFTGHPTPRRLIRNRSSARLHREISLLFFFFLAMQHMLHLLLHSGSLRGVKIPPHVTAAPPGLVSFFFPPNRPGQCPLVAATLRYFICRDLNIAASPPHKLGEEEKNNNIPRILEILILRRRKRQIKNQLPAHVLCIRIVSDFQSG